MSNDYEGACLDGRSATLTETVHKTPYYKLWVVERLAGGEYHYWLRSGVPCLFEEYVGVQYPPKATMLQFVADR